MSEEFKTPDTIWLIREASGDVTWSDDPGPSGNVHEDDVCEYVKASEVGIVITTTTTTIRKNIELLADQKQSKS